MARIIGPGIMGSMFTTESEIKSSKSTKGEKSKKKDGVEAKKDLFTDALLEAETNLDREELEEGFRELELLGKELVRNPNLTRLEEYKKSVSLFLRMAMKKMYKVENKEGLPRFGQAQKVYVNVTKIDEQLEEITKRFMREQNEPMNIIREVEGIQGIIYNIIV